VTLLLFLIGIFFPEGDNYTVVYLQEVPLHGMYMFKGERVFVPVLPLSPDPTPREESQSQFGEPVPPINILYNISFICTTTHPMMFDSTSQSPAMSRCSL